MLFSRALKAVLCQRYREVVSNRCLHRWLHPNRYLRCHCHQWCRIKFLIYGFLHTKSSCSAPKANTELCLQPGLIVSPPIRAPPKCNSKVLLCFMDCAAYSLQVWTLQCLDRSCFACQSVFISTAFMHVRLSLTDIINQYVKGYLFIAHATAFWEEETRSADTVRMGTR